MSKQEASRKGSSTASQVIFGLFLGLGCLGVYHGLDEHLSWGFGDGTSIHFRSLRGTTSVSHREDGVHLKAKMRGIIRLDDLGTGIASMGREAELWMQERRDGRRREVEITSPVGGQLSYRWWVDGRELPFDDEARAWLVRTLPSMYRLTGLDAEGRVQALLAQGGVATALAETELIPGNRVQRIYFVEILEQAEPQGEDLVAVLDAIAGLDSDFERRLALVATIPAALEEDSTREGFRRASAAFDSSYELRRTLRSVLKAVQRRTVDAPASLQLVLGASSRIRSDFELAQLLLELVEGLPSSASIPLGLSDALAQFDSDYELSRVLEVLIRRHGEDGPAVEIALRAIGNVDSDFHRAALLVELVRQRTSRSAALPVDFYRLSGALSSDFELARVLLSVVGQVDVDTDTAVSVARATEGMDSSFERARVLVALASTMPGDPVAKAAVQQAMEKLESASERQRVQRALEHLRDG